MQPPIHRQEDVGLHPFHGTDKVSLAVLVDDRRVVGDHVVGATVNAGGRLVVEATRVGADTALARIARMVNDAQTGKAQVQRLADRVSAVFVRCPVEKARS